MEHLLFVYGTLRMGCRANYLMDKAKFIGFGTIQGKLVVVSRYPGLLDGRTQDKVKGEIYAVSEDHIHRLDQYEGLFETPMQYERRIVEVEKEQGGKLEAFVYFYLLYNSRFNLEIPSGDWLEYLKRHPEENSF
jgi:gamma-glutamylcyclotransferase (GGCT)/AIG2-like uncharacterized protein YtfP